MWEYVNLNPRKKSVGDCTVRAIGIATGKDWHETYFGLVLQGAVMCDMPSANAVTTAYLRNNGFKRRTIPETCPDCYTIKDFCNEHRQGVFIIGTGSHFVAVIDGQYCDSWDSGNESPVYYFERID